MTGWVVCMTLCVGGVYICNRAAPPTDTGVCRGSPHPHDSHASHPITLCWEAVVQRPALCSGRVVCVCCPKLTPEKVCVQRSSGIDSFLQCGWRLSTCLKKERLLVSAEWLSTITCCAHHMRQCLLSNLRRLFRAQCSFVHFW